MAPAPFITACCKCKHLRDEGDSYYAKRCGAVKMSHFDAMSGETRMDGSGFAPIGIINTGNCSHFKPAERSAD